MRFWRVVHRKSAIFSISSRESPARPTCLLLMHPLKQLVLVKKEEDLQLLQVKYANLPSSLNKQPARLAY
ncbi:hypothetical protein D3C76_1702850 [compost metagenome]